MSKITLELYNALRAAGVADDLAKQAAEVVLSSEDKESLATKLDLEKLTGRINLLYWMIGVTTAAVLYVIKLLLDVLQRLPIAS